MKRLITLLTLLFLLSTAQEGKAQLYDNAVGLRLGWGFGATYKHFFSERSAVEVILRRRGFGVLTFNYNYTQVTGLYQVYKPLDNVIDGLQWYFGGGPFLGYWGGRYSGLIDGDRTYIGVAGIIGLDFAFGDLPINISIDWMPSLALLGGGGLLGEAGGLAVRYIF